MAELSGGERAYAEYFAQLKGVNSNGQALPEWEELNAERQAWWERAAIKPPGSPPFWKTKAFWANAFVLCLAAAEAQVGTLRSVLPGSIFAWVAFGLPIANAAVRGFQLLRAQP